MSRKGRVSQHLSLANRTDTGATRYYDQDGGVLREFVQGSGVSLAGVGQLTVLRSLVNFGRSVTVAWMVELLTSRLAYGAGLGLVVQNWGGRKSTLSAPFSPPPLDETCYFDVVVRCVRSNGRGTAFPAAIFPGKLDGSWATDI